MPHILGVGGKRKRSWKTEKKIFFSGNSSDLPVNFDPPLRSFPMLFPKTFRKRKKKKISRLDAFVLQNWGLPARKHLPAVCLSFLERSTKSGRFLEGNMIGKSPGTRWKAENGLGCSRNKPRCFIPILKFQLASPGVCLRLQYGKSP